VLTVQFTLNGAEYMALNGGPQYQFSPVVSLVACCDSQEELDSLWQKLSEGGQQSQCGWLIDRYGVSWQIVPRTMRKLLNSPEGAAAQRSFAAKMTMTKLDMVAIQRAYDSA